MTGVPPPGTLEQPLFFYDLGDPHCYLAAERVMSSLPAVPEWEPVLGAELAPNATEIDTERIERLALELGIQPVRWPERWPPDSRDAMLAATYAKQIGRAVAFSLAAFRQAFAGGRDLGEQDTVLIAGAACEIHPAALLKGIGMRSVISALDDATARARRAGVGSLPAIQLGGEVFEGERAVELAASAAAAVR